MVAQGMDVEGELILLQTTPLRVYMDRSDAASGRER